LSTVLIESTKNDKILVFDALAVQDGMFNKQDISKIQNIVNSATKQLNSNPKDFFEIVKIYLDEMSFEEFQLTLDEMKFVTNDNYSEMLGLIKKEKVFDNLKYLEK